MPTDPLRAELLRLREIAPPEEAAAIERVLVGAFELCAPGWPIGDVLARLADAADHLLSDHNCDHHGYEGIAAARDAARQWIKRGPRLAAATEVDNG